MAVSREYKMAISRKGHEKLSRLAYLLNCTKQDAADLAIRTLYEQEVYHREYRPINQPLTLRPTRSICSQGGRKARGEP